jgi:tetratricopeptide (TPR) repeat protein
MLGGLSIEHSAEERAPATPLAPTDTLSLLSGAAVQRRPLALLAFLATAGDRGRSRDEVLLHFWPDSTPARARRVLKQTLYALRRDLGAPDLVTANGDWFRLNPAVLTSDVAELAAALNSGDIERALALYRGPFLDGVSLGDVPEFERWARSERERLVARVEAARVAGVAERAPDEEIIIEASPARAHWRHRSTRVLTRRAIAALVALTSLGALRTARRVRSAGPIPSTVDTKVIAVLPFDVSAADTALGFLSRGMLDLLAIRLTGDGDAGLRTVSPSVVLSAWERTSSPRGASSPPAAALQFAERLSAGRVLRGSVVGTPAHLVLMADLRAVPSGKALARASVTGTADSLSVLVDRLAGMLLLGADLPDTGAEQAARAPLASTPLVAVRDYVDGKSAYRAGRYDEAVKFFDRALARDSTFAEAALGLSQSAGWAGGSEPTIQRGARLALRYQDRLSRRARLVLSATIGGADALRSGYAPDTAIVGAAERAVDANPDDPELWYWLGDRYLHLGAAIGLAAPVERASAAFRRAIALDPTFVPPFIHLIQLAARSSDTTAVRRLGTQLLQYDSTTESAQFIRWRMAVSLGDSAALRMLRARFDEMPMGTLRLILMTAECDAVALDDADEAVAAMLRRAATADERAITLVHAHAYALNRGRRADALRTTEALARDDPVPRWHLRIRVLDALYADGDTAAAQAAVDTLRRFADAPLASDLRARSAQYEDITVVTQWQLWHGDRRALSRVLKRLTVGAPSDSLRRVVASRIDASLLRALATNSGGSRDLASVDTLDNLLASNVLAPFEWPWLYPALVAARLFVISGQPHRALTAVRRRVQYFPEATYLAASLALEARLASELGDTASAAAARRELQALRSPGFAFAHNGRNDAAGARVTR